MTRQWIRIAWVACIGLANIPAHGSEAYVAELRKRGLVDATLQAQVQDVLRVLVATAANWPRGQVNGPYDGQALNVYLVDPRAQGPDARTSPGTVRAFPALRIIVADARYLAAIKAATEVYVVRFRDRSVKQGDLLVAAMTQGPDRTMQSYLGPGKDWRQGTNYLFDGAVAFLLAHEMGHVLAGLSSDATSHLSLPGHLQGRDRDRAWACASLVGEHVNRKRKEEADADAYAMRLIGAIPNPPGRKGLRYEFGTLFLQVAELGKVTATLAAISATGEQLTRGRVNPNTVAAMRDTLDGSGMVEAAYPQSHPAQVQRMLESVNRLSTNPVSVFYGDPDNALDRMMLDRLVQKTCESVGAPAAR